MDADVAAAIDHHKVRRATIELEIITAHRDVVFYGKSFSSILSIKAKTAKVGGRPITPLKFYEGRGSTKRTKEVQ